LCCYEVFAQDQTTNKELQQVYEYYQVDKLPYYEGTSDFKPALDRNLEWPDPFHGEGRVILSFVVSTEGKLRDIQILRGLCEPCDDNAINALKKLVDWTPGKINGQAVSTRMYVSVNFRIQY
jgi:protein TonB